VIGEKNISPNEYTRAFNDRMTRLIAQNGDTYTKEMAISQGLGSVIETTLVNRRSLDVIGARLGLRVTDNDLAAYITDIPGLKDSFGKFDRFRFSNIARQQGMTEKRLEETIREDMVRSELVKTLTDTFEVPVAFQNALFRLNKEKRTADVVQIIPATVKDIAKATDEDLKKYYEDNSSRYMAPEYRTFDYISIKANDFNAEATVTDEEIAEFYKSRLDQYTTEEKRSINIMMFDDEEQAKAAAAEIASGKDFDAVNLRLTETTANENLTDPQTRTEIEEFFGEDSANFIFSAKTDDISDVINTEFGYRIFKVAKIEAGKVTELKDIRITLEIEAKKNKAAEILYQKHAAITESIADGASLEEISETHGLKIKNITDTNKYGLTKDNKAAANLPGIGEFLNVAFEIMPGDDIELYNGDDDNQYFIISMNEVTETKLKEFETVKAAVNLAWEYTQREKKAEEIANAIIAKTSEGQKLADILKEYPDLKLTNITESRQPEKQEIDPAIHKAMFDNAVGTTAKIKTQFTGAYVIVSVISSEASTATPDNAARAGLSQAINSNYRNDVLVVYQQYLNKKLPVRVNKAVTRQIIKSILGSEEDNG
jgi:peptidyl-prolyl cis-trans isomerase D